MERNGHYRFTFDVTKNGLQAGLLAMHRLKRRNVSNMISSTKSGFCKNEACPSSNELLDFQNGDLVAARGKEISRHLMNCEFCEAEVEFYSHYPQELGAYETPEKIEIPAPLFELAEALLKHRHTDARALNSMLRETTLTDKV